MITPIVGKTHEEAEEKYKELQLYGDQDGAQALFSGWTGIDIGKYGPDENINENGTNAVKSFLKLWNKNHQMNLKELLKLEKKLLNKLLLVDWVRFLWYC